MGLRSEFSGFEDSSVSSSEIRDKPVRMSFRFGSEESKKFIMGPMDIETQKHKKGDLKFNGNFHLAPRDKVLLKSGSQKIHDSPLASVHSKKDQPNSSPISPTN